MKKMLYRHNVHMIVLFVIITILLASCQTKAEFLGVEQPKTPVQDEQIPELSISVDSSDIEQENKILEPEFLEEPQNDFIINNSFASGYFTADEAQYSGIVVGKTSAEEMLILLGEPVSCEIEAETMWYNNYYYADAHYYAAARGYPPEQTLTIESIYVNKKTDVPSPRGIRIGDTFDDVLHKFPQEKDYLSSPEGYFYGDDMWSEEPVGFVLKDNNSVEIVVATSSWGPALKIFFEDGEVIRYMIFIPE